MPCAVMKIADGIAMLEVEMNMMGRTNTINPTLLYDENHAFLVDVGMPRQVELLRTAVEKEGVSFDRIDGVILTHQDIDHIGGINDVQNTLGKGTEVYAHAEDVPYIEGSIPPIKMNKERVGQMLSSLPEQARKEAEAVFLNPPTAKVTQPLADGEVLPYFGGIEVVFTPGHTPGHISLYHKASKTLIAGDATVSENGKLLGPMPSATPDMARAVESLKRFTELDIERVICYHGGLCEDNVLGQLGQLVK